MKDKKIIRIAILHDEFIEFGGAEKVVISLAKYLDADVITSKVSKEAKRLIPKDINLILLNYKSNNFFTNLEKLFSSLNVGKYYDFFILSKYHTLFAAKKHHPNLAYVHGLPYLPENRKISYYNANPLTTTYIRLVNLKKKYFNLRINKNITLFIDTLLGKYSKENYMDNFYRLHKYLDTIISNSNYVLNNLSKYYRINSKVIYPPINTNLFKFDYPDNYWLSINRLDSQKYIKIQVDAFSKLPSEKLIIIGNITNLDYYNTIIKEKPNNVKFLGLLDEASIASHLSKCKGFITASIGEAFGMAAVEAMASGKPVIAPNEGGYRETIINGVTGKLIDDINPDKLVKAIKEMDEELKKNPLKYKNACIKQAKKFDTKIFIKRIKEEINIIIKENGKNTRE